MIFIFTLHNCFQVHFSIKVYYFSLQRAPDTVSVQSEVNVVQGASVDHLSKGNL